MNDERLDIKEYKKKIKGKVFVKNVPWNIEIGKIEKIFRKFGDIIISNFPKSKNKEGVESLKGYGFIEFAHKNMALKAVKNLNNKTIDGRKIEVSLAVPKKSYNISNNDENNKTNEETQENNHNNNNLNSEITAENNLDKTNVTEDYKNSKIEDTNNNINNNINKEVDSKSLLNDPQRTLFIQNINYSTTDTALYNFFKKFGPVIYCKICKNKDNNSSKGKAFVMFKNIETCNSILNSYNKVISEKSEINPFEVDNKYLKILKAYDKSDSSQIPVKKEDRRNREFLLYGLYNHFNGDLNDIDKEKRENFIASKKESFKNNPNLFTSKNRICVRNFNKKINQEVLSDLIKEHTNNWINSFSDNKIKKKLNNTKLIKQIKMINDTENINKNKGKLYVQIDNQDLSKYLIEKLSNIYLKDSDKGLILDYALEDARKVHKRNVKIQKALNDVKEKKKELKKQTNITLSKNTCNSKDKNEEFNKIKPINDYIDTQELANLYCNVISRGKKQRIKDRILRLLNNNKEETNKLIDKYEKKKLLLKNTEDANTKMEEYKLNILESDNTDINKKSKKFRKDLKNNNYGKTVKNTEKHNQSYNKLNKKRKIVN